MSDPCASIQTIPTIWTRMASLFRQVLTGQDNLTHDLGRWSWVICTAAVLVHDAWQVTHRVGADVKDLALALSAVAAAHGAALGFKSTTEPKG